MARVLAHRASLAQPAIAEAARLAIVVGCALSLMLAGRALPF